jgi:hypothetical protein
MAMPARSTISAEDLPTPKAPASRRQVCTAPPLPGTASRPAKPSAASTDPELLGGRYPRLASLSTPEFLAQEYPEPTWLVPGFMTAGLAVVAGPPKVGKTWLLIQMAIAASLGTPFLGKDLRPTGALYVSLEGNVNFLQNRVRTLCTTGEPENLRWCFEANRLHDGLEPQIEAFLKEFAGTGLVIIDTLVRVNPLDTRRRTQYQEDADTLRSVELMASAWPETTFLFVHHTRECRADDPLDSLAGSRGLTGTIDNAWILAKNANVDADAVLACRGRNLPAEEDLALTFNKATCLWEVKGAATQFVGGETRHAIHDALVYARDEDEGGLTPAQLAKDTGVAPGTIRSTLGRMVKAGQVVNTRGTYTLPDDDRSVPSDPRSPF